jgi:inward rectifier potassium channel
MRDRTPNFIMSWMVFHVIDEQSPLFGLDAESIKKSGLEFAASLVGTDETFAQTVHARHRWGVEDVLFDKRFADMTSPGEGGRIILDYTKFDQVIDV